MILVLIYIHIPLLISKSKINKFKKGIESGSYYSGDSNSFYDIYAGEINWSNFVKNTEQSYSEEQFEINELVCEYRWSGWSKDRYQNPNFPFLNPKISNINQLWFNLKDLAFYNSKNEQVTKFMWTESAKLYYIKKELLESIIKQQKKELVWYQFVSKYGELGKYSENKLNPTYKDLRKLVQYTLIK